MGINSTQVYIALVTALAPLFFAFKLSKELYK